MQACLAREARTAHRWSGPDTGVWAWTQHGPVAPKRIKLLAREGIPASLRPRLWFRFSGAQALIELSAVKSSQAHQPSETSALLAHGSSSGHRPLHLGAEHVLTPRCLAGGEARRAHYGAGHYSFLVHHPILGRESPPLEVDARFADVWRTLHPGTAWLSSANG